MPMTPATSEWLRVDVKSTDIGVDREHNVINGFVVAQEGLFKSEGRGEFDLKSLRQIVKLMKSNRNGTKMRFGHPTLSGDGLGDFLGRAKSPRLDTVTVERDGELRPLAAVRADAHLAAVALQPSASGFSIGEHVLTRAEDDPDSFSSSLVLKTDEVFRQNSDGSRKLDEEGNELPPLWRPLEIHASDVVDTGDAVDGFLSADGLRDDVLRQGYQMLEQFLPGHTREVVEARLQAWLGKALQLRFGDPGDPSPVIATEDLRRRLGHKRRSILMSQHWIDVC